jgi:pimeloyl-ACP methyl ester carboxylesterase
VAHTEAAGDRPPGPEAEGESILLHGQRVTFRSAGSGPALLLLHGVAGSGHTWDEVIPWLAEDHTVIAPDLLGHGGSAKPRGDYSLGAYASGARDLLSALGHDSATVVGHSLGGGIAMQFVYQFPERVERLALVSSGGLGREVSLLLRAAALPGAEWVLPVLAGARLDAAGAAVGRLLGRVGLRPGSDLDEIARGIASLSDGEARQAFLHTVRSVVDTGGQRVDATDRLYLAAGVPTLLIWGDGDRIIPVAHGRAAHERMPGSRLEVFEGAGHFPHRDDPYRFVSTLREFMTQPGARLDADAIRGLMLEGGRTMAS